jgi:uncharacterized protein YegP (UPF0339 family)
MRNTLRLVTWKDKHGQFRFHWKRNGKILMSGEGYKRRQSMDKMLNLFLDSIIGNSYQVIEKK